MRQVTRQSVRPSAARRGYGGRWQRLSKRFLRENPLCRYCKRRGLIVAATQVDHIIPHRGDQRLFWDQDNWQPLCAACGAAKSAQEQASYRTGKVVIAPGCGTDGAPIDPAHPWFRARER